MGFWNALSVLAPVAPALSDAQDIRTQRTQDAAKFAQDQELGKARLTIDQMAAEGARQQNAIATRDEQDRQTVRQQLGVPLRKYKGADGADYTDYFTPNGVKSVADAPSNEDRFQNYLSSLKKMGINLTPEQEAAVSPEFYGAKGLPASKFTPLSGAAGQPQLGPDGKSSVVYGKDENGNIVSKPMDANFKPVVKTPTNDTRFIAITGRPQSTWTPEESEFVQGYKNMVSTKVTEPGVARMNALAQNRIVTPIDPNNPSAEIYATAGQAMRQGMNAPGSIDYRLQMPTGAERGRADLAMSAREQMNDLENILTTRSDLFGPVAGKVTNLTQWLGTQDPDAQRFQAAARVTADHLAGVFGGRSQTALQAIYEVVGRNATNPKAAIAGLEQMDKAARTIEIRGVGAKAAGAIAPSLGSAAKTYKQTATGANGHQIGSNDDGNTWFDVKTGKKI